MFNLTAYSEVPEVAVQRKGLSGKVCDFNMEVGEYIHKEKEYFEL